MKHLYPSLTLFLVTLLFPIISYSQLYTGINTSSWAGVSNVTWNPAVAAPRYAVDISLGGWNSGIVSDHAKLNAGGIFQNTDWNSILNNNTANPNIWKEQVKEGAASGGFRTIHQFTQLEMPGSFLLPFKGKNAIAISAHFNAVHSVVGLDGDLANLSTPNNSAPAGNTGNNSNFSLTNAAWMDYGFTYSRVAIDKGAHFFKFGFTAKLLQILDVNTITASNLQYNFSPSSLSITGGTMTQAGKPSTPFSGAGDIGFVYEYRPKKDKYRYQMDSLNDILPRFKDLHLLSFGFSVIDMGALTTGNALETDIKIITTNNLSFFNTDQVRDGLQLSGGRNTQRSATILLPMRFNLYVDYNIAKGFGLNLSSSISPFASSTATNLSYGSYVALTPRFDLPLFGAYLPVNVNFNGKVGMGLSMRLGPVWLGMSDLIGLGTGINNNVIYGGIKIPIIYHKQRDKDKDMVSNKNDLCEYKKGTWATQGCPDRDGDGIRDEIDVCPDAAGPANTRGCPDTDADGIKDDIDSCRTQAGLAENFGCPDRDGDGVIDKYDLCRDSAGVKALNGCPDTDGDGVPNKDDRCPTLAGSKDHHGCPDTDKDGVYDDEDNDVFTPGPVENHGAPWGDTDGDGITDDQDKCPSIKGPVEYRGCPTPPKANLVKELTASYDTIYFEPNSTSLSKANLQVLKNYVKLMNDEKNAATNNAVLVGRADSIESADSLREKLSLDRANAVKDALVGLGLDIRRIEVQASGAIDPIGDNKNPISRRRNRSVAIINKIVTE